MYQHFISRLSQQQPQNRNRKKLTVLLTLVAVFLWLTAMARKSACASGPRHRRGAHVPLEGLRTSPLRSSMLSNAAMVTCDMAHDAMP